MLCATAARFAVRAELNGRVGTLGYGMALALSGLPRPPAPAGLRDPHPQSGGRPRAWPRGRWRSGSATTRSPLLQAGFALSRFDSTEWIGDIDVPTSVVVTTLDKTVAPARQWHLAQSIPGATAFPVAGHPPGLRGPGAQLCPGVAGGLCTPSTARASGWGRRRSAREPASGRPGGGRWSARAGLPA